MAKAEELNTDWQRSAGDFHCLGPCQRKRLPASEFSKKQVERALDSLRNIADKDIRTGPEIQTVLYLSGVCKRCTEDKERQAQADAAARRAGNAGNADAEAEPDVAGEQVEVTLSSRPFGLTPSSKGPGYVVLKASEGKPAAKAGVRPGWRLVAIDRAEEGADLPEWQSRLKAAELPVKMTFETLGSRDFCTSCQEILPGSSFSRKMRTKPPEKRRCSACVEDAAEEGPNENGEQRSEAAEGAASKLSELKQLCAETAKEAEQVTGLKAVRGAGRGRGRGYKRP
ncbi:unnamed protein product [Cladocopium goreaui]|uniref:PDZ domain-containing protein n=1 Tax=Cladocopium goreaui TaxID=2562237 RepID=A0A9P1M179_9DINO|nr:unnamed protein product [Cladocopium goreaui]